MTSGSSASLTGYAPALTLTCFFWIPFQNRCVEGELRPAAHACLLCATQLLLRTGQRFFGGGQYAIEPIEWGHGRPTGDG